MPNCGDFSESFIGMIYRNCNSWLCQNSENGPGEIVDLAMKHDDFPVSYLSLPEGLYIYRRGFLTMGEYGGSPKNHGCFNTKSWSSIFPTGWYRHFSRHFRTARGNPVIENAGIDQQMCRYPLLNIQTTMENHNF